MMLICAKCSRKQPLSDEDVAAFYPRFFCFTCGAKIPFDVSEAKVFELRHSNDTNRALAKGEIAAVPVEAVRKVAKAGGPAAAASDG